ncbi:MAG TPA: TonB-dependent receptor [Pyrinomonadaceae bacterium]|jgi:hypothetical protein
MKHDFRHLAFLMIIAFVSCLSLNGLVSAQEVTGAITGTVLDPNGAAVRGAQVVVSSVDRGLERTYQTDDEGIFSAPLLPPGTYSLTIEAAGFKKYVQSDIRISVNDRRPVEVRLETGGVTETVNVTAEPSVIQESPTQQALIEGSQVRQLPLNNRNFVQLATLAPGVTSSNSSQIGFGGLAVVQISINGGRTSAINWLVDGSRNVDSGSNLTLLTVPSVDAIQEFTVLTSNYAPEFGRNGGGVVNVVTRQGTNDFHGTLYEFVRNDALNARDPFITTRLTGLGSATDPRFKQPLRYNDFGGTIGGPVFFPNIGDDGPTIYNGRNRTYFFFSQEFRRVRSSSIPVGTVATNAQRSGVFTTPIIDPLTGQPFANNTIPQNRFNPNSVALLNYILAPNEGTNQFRRVSPVAGNFRQSIFRFDHNFTANTTFTARYIQDNFDRTDPGGNIFLDPFVITQVQGTLFPNVASQQTSTPGKNFVASLKFGLSPAVINEVAFDYAFNKIQSTFTGTGLRSNTPGFTSPELFAGNLQGALPGISITGLQGLTFQSPQDIENPSYTLRDNLTWVRGNHTFKFGAFLAKEEKNENAGNNLNGTISFNGTRTASAAVPGSGNAFADFLLGLPSQFSEAQNEIRVQLRYNTYEFYAQDSWKVSPRLTIDYGARYSIYENPIEASDYLITFLPRLYDPSRQVTLTPNGNFIDLAAGGERFNGIAFAGQNSPYGRRVQSNQYNTIGPRVGFAYNVFGDGKTIIRGGFGVFYDRTLTGIVEQNAFLNPRIAQTQVIDNPTTINDPRIGTPNNAIGVAALITTGDEFKPPQTLQYSLGLQRELFRNTFVEVAYVGNSSHNLLRQVNINLPLPRFARSGGTLPRNFYRPFRGYGNINERRTDADSNYNSAQFTLTRRFTDGLQFGAVYTFSKNITESSTDRSDTIQNPLRPDLERALSQFDRTHVFTASFLYELPFGREKMFDLGSFGNAILGGFQLAGIYTLQSGTPLTITQTAGTFVSNGVSVTTPVDPFDQGYTLATVRPNLICDPTLPRSERTVTRWFNTGCFSPVLANSTSYGNAGRGIVRGPGINNLDVSLYRTFGFTESMNLQLRAEFFNVLNTTQYNNPIQTLGSSNFGAITSARDARIIQFGAKFNF